MTTEKNTSLCVLGEHDCFFYTVENMGFLKGEAGGEVMVGALDDGTMLFEVLSAIPGSDYLRFSMTLEHLKALYEAAQANAGPSPLPQDPPNAQDIADLVIADEVRAALESAGKSISEFPCRINEVSND